MTRHEANTICNRAITDAEYRQMLRLLVLAPKHIVAREIAHERHTLARRLIKVHGLTQRRVASLFGLATVHPWIARTTLPERSPIEQYLLDTAGVKYDKRERRAMMAAIGTTTFASI